MKFARGLLIFSYGLFSIAAQTLLFREFVTTFEGNDISVGVFFASWFLWIGLGALVVRRAGTAETPPGGPTEFLFLAYLPAFVLQAVLTIQARELAGLQSYALWSIRDILLVSAIVNAPISFVTGALFPIACRWFAADPDGQSGKLPISNVYSLEAAGSFAGGIGVTILLGMGMSLAVIFFVLALVLSASVFAVQLARNLSRADVKVGVRRITCAFSFLAVLGVCLCLALGADKTLMDYVRAVKWSKLLPKEALTGSFQTAQAEYLYGTYQDQWVAIREGGVTEALPDESAAGRVAAVTLCQKPDARNVLVVGTGLGLCRELLKLPQIETVTWAHCDRQYELKVNRFIPAELRVTDPRLHLLAGDVRALLAEKRELYDIVILNLPDATSSVLNRYYTAEFYRQAKQALTTDGVLAVRVAGGENIMGTELVNLGASTKRTLEQVFSRLVLAPGEDSWFIASDSQTITGEPGSLRDRFASIKGADRVLAPDALLSVYLPDRAAAALESYARADLPERFLINHDSRPLTHLYSLLLAAKQSGAPAARLVKHFALAGPLPFLVPIMVLVVLRVVYALRPARQGSPSGFDGDFLVFSTGAAGIGAVIVLMYLYQTRFGSLYLHIGVVSSLFMAGLAVGATLARRLLARRRETRTEVLLLVVVFVHSLLLCAIALRPSEPWSHAVFALTFVLCGLCTGFYFPIAAGRLADCGFETGRAASMLESADHFGAVAGGAVTSLALVPVLGAETTLLVFVALILANVPPAVLRILRPFGFRFKSAIGNRQSATYLPGLGYGLLGVGISLVLCSNLLAAAGARLRVSLPQYAVAALAGPLRTEKASVSLGQDARKADYFNIRDANDKLVGYIIGSEDFAPDVRGFGGKIGLAVRVDDPNGKLVGFHIVRSNETPAYLELLRQWCDSLPGLALFKGEPFAGVHAVSGATISSEAILSALQTSSRRFAEQVLGRQVEAVGERATARPKHVPDVAGIYLIGAFVLAFIVTYAGGFRSRLVVLCGSLIAGGLWLNAQYSSDQIVTLLSWHTPAAALAGVFLFVVGIPLVAILFGNVYCGYVCPFGAAQELLGYIVPRRFKPPLSVESMRTARFVKYVMLLVVIAVFFASRNRTTLASDPLISVFGLHLTGRDIRSTMLWIAAAALIGSVFCTRFWCRYLCPAGAFLSLLNAVALFKRYLPAKKYGRCPFGLTGRDNADCIQCDKCRFEELGGTRAQPRASAKVFVACVLVVALLASAVSVGRFLEVIPAGAEGLTLSASGGQPRDVDLQRVRTMIREKRLSDKEADFYKKIE
jgi:spermidine synthase